MDARVAGFADLDGIVNTLTSAFTDDPVWGWAFPERDSLEAWWELFVGSALEYPNTWIAGDFAAVAVWIPPGKPELTEDAEAAIEPLLNGQIGDRASEVLTLVDRFDSNHPEQPPHYYLSLLGTHPAHRGKGLGTALLAENLSQIDAEGASAYLESTNPANNARYERLGFRQVGSFERPDGKAVATTMLRQAGQLSM